MKRQVVLRTAARIFSRRGFHQTALSDIAEELHIAKPTLYHYFRSKDEILLLVQQLAIAQITDVAIDAHPAAATGMEQLRAFVRRYIEMIVDDFGACLIMTGILPLQAENRKLIRQGSKDIESMLREILRRGVADGSIAPCDPKITAMFFFGVTNWVPYWYRPDGEIDVDGLTERALAFLINGVGPRP
ncbi:MAG TPA: TetR/AcrR family transcriptional regulator [Caulobacteraceae bacterium]|nr:TetR/AcrR family transcriptional regulator [Caulobacteraceae bacterium]